MYRMGLRDCVGFDIALEEQPDPSAGVFPEGGSPDPRVVISSETLMDALPPVAEAANHKFWQRRMSWRVILLAL